MNKKKVSVLVAIYNPIESKLKDTLISIIRQKMVTTQIIITDDGSGEDYSFWLDVFFAKYGYTDYKYIRSNANQGTVRNYLQGIEICDYYFVKCLSPGDMLYNDSVLFEWVEHCLINHSKWSFGDAAYYTCDENDNKKIISGLAFPMNVTPYIHRDVDKIIWNYVVFKDQVLGANTLCEKTILEKYLKLIVDKVIYAEDNIYRIMSFDGLIGSYFDSTTIYYEQGTGVSTSNSKVWEQRLHIDFIASQDIIQKRCCTKSQKYMLNQFDKWYKRKGFCRIFSLLTVRGGIFFWIEKKWYPRKTQMVNGLDSNLNL